MQLRVVGFDRLEPGGCERVKYDQLQILVLREKIVKGLSRLNEI